MSLDPITEKIAHFIGSFDMLVEQARMREAYDEFRALLAEEAEANRMQLLSHKAKHSYKLEDLDPALKVTLPTGDLRFQEGPDGLAPEAIGPLPENIPLSFGPEVFQAPMSVLPGVPAGMYSNFVLPQPASVITVTHQTATLFDNDIFGNVQADVFQPLEPILSALHELAKFAQSLSVIQLDGVSQGTDWFQVAADISAAAAQVMPVDNGNVVISLFQGEQDIVLVNGEEAESLPEWEDIIPVYHAIKRSEAEEEAAEAENPEHDFAKDFETEGSAAAYQNTGTEVVAGANTLVNSASVYSAWLDASVFAVAGNVLRFDAISQVNVLVEHDLGFGPYAQNQSEILQSKTISAASIRELSVAEAELEALEKSEAEDDPAEDNSENVDEEDQPADTEQASSTTKDHGKQNDPIKSGSHPSNWAVVRHDGDVVQINTVQQYTFASDMDQAVLTFGAATTFLGLGENLVNNSFNAAQFGYGYDLIIIAGDMIELNLIDQVNVMLDSDLLIPKGAPAQADIVSDTGNGTQHSSLSQGAQIVGQSAEAEPIKMDNASAIDTEPSGPTNPHIKVGSGGAAKTVENAASELTNESAETAEGHLDVGETEEMSFAAKSESAGNAPAQTAEAVAEDVNDQGDVGADIFASDEPEPASVQDAAELHPAPPGLSTQDNLLYNKASIEKTGKDTDADITETFIAAIEEFAKGSEDVSEDVVQDDLFLGTELLKVLYVDGDFTTANILSQTNILGDSDQLQIAQDHFAAALQKEIEITTGSNIEANFASIKDNGVDSTVMAKGDTYSDALIHQANLVDKNIPAAGAMGLGNLASEAVAFLAEGLIGPDLAEEITANTNQMVADTLAQALGTEAVLT